MKQIAWTNTVCGQLRNKKHLKTLGWAGLLQNSGMSYHPGQSKTEATSRTSRILLVLQTLADRFLQMLKTQWGLLLMSYLMMSSLIPPCYNHPILNLHILPSLWLGMLKSSCAMYALWQTYHHHYELHVHLHRSPHAMYMSWCIHHPTIPSYFQITYCLPRQPCPISDIESLNLVTLIISLQVHKNSLTVTWRSGITTVLPYIHKDGRNILQCDVDVVVYIATLSEFCPDSSKYVVHLHYSDWHSKPQELRQNITAELCQNKAIILC